jgi:glycosyltransferase involved in cell wall biosynthesis
MSQVQAAHIEDVHLRLLQRADVVFCDSPHERRFLQARVPGRNNCTFLSLGCDFSRFRPGSLRRREQLLFVGDLAEPRKRFDRVIEVFRRLVITRPALRLVVIGNRSDEVRGLISPELRHACTLRGYVGEADLQREYRESLGLFLLSDFEAFGIPILEALASGTPVFLTRQPTTESLFGSFRGAHFCPPDDLEGTIAIVESTLARGAAAIQEVIQERTRLQFAFDWDRLAARKWDALAAAWFRNHGWAKTA